MKINSCSLVDPLNILMPELENDAQNAWTIQLIYPGEQSEAFLDHKNLELSIEDGKELIEMPDPQLQLMVEDPPAEENQVIGPRSYFQQFFTEDFRFLSFSRERN